MRIPKEDVKTPQPLRQNLIIAFLAYNSELASKASLEALVAQTYKNKQIRVYDDSTDSRSSEMLRQYCDSKKIYYIKNSERIGQVNSFKKAAIDSVDSCEYFMWACQDDLWDPTYAEACINALNEKKLSHVSTQYFSVNSRTHPSEANSNKWIPKSPHLFRSFSQRIDFLVNSFVILDVNRFHGVYRAKIVKEFFSKDFSNIYDYHDNIMINFIDYSSTSCILDKRLFWYSNPSNQIRKSLAPYADGKAKPKALLSRYDHLSYIRSVRELLFERDSGLLALVTFTSCILIFAVRKMAALAIRKSII